MAWFKRSSGAETGGGNPQDFKFPEDKPKSDKEDRPDLSRRNFFKTAGIGLGAMAAAEVLAPVAKALDQQKKKSGTEGELQNVERLQGKRVEVKGVQSEEVARQIKVSIESFLQDPQIKFETGQGAGAVQGPLSLEFTSVVVGTATMNEVAQQGKQSANQEVDRHTYGMGNGANTGTITGRAEQAMGQIAGAIIRKKAHDTNDKIFGLPQGDIRVSYKTQNGRSRGEASSEHSLIVRYSFDQSKNKVNLLFVKDGGREIPGSKLDGKSFVLGSPEMNDAVRQAIVDAAILDARSNTPVKSQLSTTLMNYATAKPGRPEQKFGSPTQGGKAGQGGDGLLPLYPPKPEQR